MKYFLTLSILLVCLFGQSQNSTKLPDVNYEKLIYSIERKVDSLMENSDNWDKVLDLLEVELSKKNLPIKWLSNANIDFKTFQNADSSNSSLGFSYDFNIERAKIKERNENRIGKSISFESKGNVAFSREINPNDFLNTKLALNLFYSGGGTLIDDKSLTMKELSNLRKQIAVKYKSAEEILSSEEWVRINNSYVLKNSWIIKSDLNTSLESNQDFSKTQQTFGLRLGASVKSWDDENILAKWNLIDYPFALIRRITGYDTKVRASGANIPSILFNFDYVNPLNDTIRENIDPELNPFPRVNFEIGYRTPLTEVATQTLFFNCSFRYYTEIGASAEIKENSLDTFPYFTSSISSSDGFYISYSYGRLPFDKQDDAVYEIGFRYKFK